MDELHGRLRHDHVICTSYSGSGTALRTLTGHKCIEYDGDSMRSVVDFTHMLGHGLVKYGLLICVTVKHLSDLCQLHHRTA
jgi:hypothetical protein